MLIVPLSNEPDSRRQVLLGENLLTLRTYWNSLAGVWFMDVADVNSQSLARGLALLPGVNLLETEPELTRTLGQLRVITLDNVPEVTRENLGAGARLWWFAPGEWEANDLADNVLTALPFDVSTMYFIDPQGVAKALRYDGSFAYDGEFFYDGIDTRP